MRKLFALTALLAIIAAIAGCKGGSADDNDGPPSGKAFPHVYIADSGNNRIVRMDDISGRGWVEVGTFGHGADHLYGPNCVAVDSKIRIYVGDDTTDDTRERIIRFDDMKGSNWVAFGESGHGTNQFNKITDIAFDSQGRIYVVDQGNYRIVRIDDMTGRNWAAFGTDDKLGDKPGAFALPEGIAVDGRGRIYVADKDRIARFDDMTGKNWTTYGPADGSRAFAHNCRIALDGENRIFVLDRSNNRIVRMDDMTGKNWKAFKTFGEGIDKLQLTEPHGMALDPKGSIYITDGIGVDSDTGDPLNISRIVKADPPNFKSATTFGIRGAEMGQFDFPNSIYIR